MTAPLPIDDTTPALDHALPGWAVDVIRDGVPATDPTDPRPLFRRIFGACVSVAQSAHRRGWTESQYRNAIADTHSALWAQLMTRRDGRRNSFREGFKQLSKAWSYGVANTNNVGMLTAEELAANAVERAYEWSDRLDSGSDGLSATETAVMRYVLTQVEERGRIDVTCPRRAVADAARIGEEAAKGALARLARRGLLVKVSAGRPGAPGKGKAAIFRLQAPPAEHPIYAVSTPMGCSETGEASAAPEPTAPERAALASVATETAGTPHRCTTEPETTGTPHRCTAEPETAPVAHREVTDPNADGSPWLRAFDVALRAEGIDPEVTDTPEWMDTLARLSHDGHTPEAAAAMVAERCRMTA